MIVTKLWKVKWVDFACWLILVLQEVQLFILTLSFVMLQDDSYIDSYISTIGVDFVSITLQRSILHLLKQFLISSFCVALCRKSALLSRMGRPLSSRLYVYDWLCFSSFVYWYYIFTELDLTFCCTFFSKMFFFMISFFCLQKPVYLWSCEVSCPCCL
jgi:hypothetical protein